MNALTAVQLYGQALIGQTILTEKIGDYPGGPATVIEIWPDENAPDIPIMVSNPAYRDLDGDNTMGIMVHEEIQILTGIFVTAGWE